MPCTGDNRGLTFIMDICEPGRSTKASHFLVPMPSIKSLDPEDLSYLRAKGAFSLPHADVREALIRCYFHHVHPFAPILDTQEFIVEYDKGRTSLLLLWSMFLAAASVSRRCVAGDVINILKLFSSSTTSISQMTFSRQRNLLNKPCIKESR